MTHMYCLNASKWFCTLFFEDRFENNEVFTNFLMNVCQVFDLIYPMSLNWHRTLYLWPAWSPNPPNTIDFYFWVSFKCLVHKTKLFYPQRNFIAQITEEEQHVSEKPGVLKWVGWNSMQFWCLTFIVVIF